jgi:hypothetical protein
MRIKTYIIIALTAMLYSVGHMWYSIHNGSDNKPLSFGFGSAHGKSSGIGETTEKDDSYYLSTIYTRQIEITQEQYNKQAKNAILASLLKGDAYLTAKHNPTFAWR